MKFSNYCALLKEAGVSIVKTEENEEGADGNERKWAREEGNRTKKNGITANECK